MGFQVLETDITGHPARCPISLQFKVTGEQIRFGARVAAAPDYNADLASGSFHSGLWRQDCAELFIAAGDSVRYLELNLAPSGAWWCCFFDAPRCPSAHQPNLRATTIAKVEADLWSAELQLPLQDIEARLGPHDLWSVNMTVIIGGCDDQNPNPSNLHSLVRLDPNSPDFHAPHLFVRAERIRS